MNGHRLRLRLRTNCRRLYNRRSELAAATVGADRYGYAYDSIGNRLWSAANAVTNSYTANSLNQYTAISANANPVYDADGNMAFDGVLSYSYDSENRLVSVSSNGTVLVFNEYDHKGRRISKTTPTAVTTFFYDGWDLIHEHEVIGSVTNEIFYYWGKDISGTLQGAGGIGGLLYLKRNGTIYVPHMDAYGNIVRYTDTAGNIVASYAYGAFGNLLSGSGTLANIFRHRFSSKYYDVEAGLYYYGYRFYHPVLMRWLNRDPLEEEGGANQYAFCVNNPLINYDGDGCAYFAVRKLKGSPGIIKWSTFYSCPFSKAIIDMAADYFNVELLHEQLFFEDGRQGIRNIGWGTDEHGNASRLVNESPKGYTRRDEGYDDCIMRIAVERVNPDHYQLTWFGSKTKCNCQDYAAALRAKYRELENDAEIKCKCKKEGVQ